MEKVPVVACNISGPKVELNTKEDVISSAMTGCATQANDGRITVGGQRWELDLLGLTSG